MRCKLVLLSAFAVCWGTFASAQQNPPPAAAATESAKPRPKIGVALEGGGALGEAHVGVLRWFEENHIPVDYLAGTSMGGLIGGMYATGKSSTELEDILTHANWSLLLEGATPYQDLAFRRKEDAREVPNSIKIGLKNGPALPPGLNSGHQIDLLIDRETLAYGNVTDFDKLPIPFRCVSTELVSGKPYVFKEGSLSEAMRATMSIPGVFAPVRRGNQIFVDGGLVNNLPTNVVKSMGADVVIGIHLQISQTSAKDIQSAFGVLGRSVELVIAETELRGMEGADLVVRVDVEKFSTSDYDETAKLVKAGYDAAAEKAQILKVYSLNDADWAEYQRQKRAREQVLPGAPQYVRVEGVDQRAADSIAEFLQPELNKPLDPKSIDQRLTRLTGVGRYDSITYDVKKDANGTEELVVHVSEKGYAPPFLQPSFVVDGTEPDDVTFTFGARLTFMDVAGYRSEWRTDLQFGETYGIYSELYKPIHPLSKWYVLPFINADQQSFNIYYKTNPRAEYRLDNVLAGGSFGYNFNRFNDIRIGYGYGYESATLRLGAPEFSSFSGAQGAMQLRYIRDHTNDPVIPTSGHFIQSYFRWVTDGPRATEAFPSMTLELAYFHPVLKGDSIYIRGEGGSTFGYQGTGTPQFFLGGTSTLAAYGTNELFGNQYFVGRIGYLHKIFELPTFVGRQVYFTGFGDIGKMYGDPTAPRLSADGAAGIIAITAVGPVFIGGSVGDTGHQKWFFQLGRVF